MLIFYYFHYEIELLTQMYIVYADIAKVRVIIN